MYYHILTDCANLGMKCKEDGTCEADHSTIHSSVEELRRDLMTCWCNEEHLSMILKPEEKISVVMSRLGSINTLIETDLSRNLGCCKVFVYVSLSDTVSLTKEEVGLIFPGSVGVEARN